MRLVLRELRVVSVYTPAFAGAYPRKNGQAELTLGGWLNTKMARTRIEPRTSLVPVLTRFDL